MLRLWPESLELGLFPELCWLRTRGRKTMFNGKTSMSLTRTDVGSEPKDLLKALESLLADYQARSRLNASVRVLVSDSVAATSVLPWQEQLTSPEEKLAYAQACFARKGVELDDMWILHAGFRHFEGNGFAHALPKDWLESLSKLLQDKRCKVQEVLPVSAHGYWHTSLPRGKQQKLLLLREAQRTSALVFGAYGLLRYDVEPATSAAHAGMRLLRRIQVQAKTIATVDQWSPLALRPIANSEFIKTCLPEAKHKDLPVDAWC